MGDFVWHMSAIITVSRGAANTVLEYGSVLRWV